MASVNRRVLPGFSLYARIYRLLSERAGHHSDHGVLPQSQLAVARRIRQRGLDGSRASGIFADVRCGFRRGRGERRARVAARVGAGALRISAEEPARLAGGSTARASDRGCGNWFTARCTYPPAGSASISCRSAFRARTRGSDGARIEFVGLPFVVRTVQPILEDLDPETEDAERVTRRHALADVPSRDPAAVVSGDGDGLRSRVARGIGEYGAVVFVSGNMPFKTEIAPILIVARLEEFAYAKRPPLPSCFCFCRSPRCC